MTKSNPDMYGPFWIMTTLIYLLACIGNLTTYFDVLNSEDF